MLVWSVGRRVVEWFLEGMVWCGAGLADRTTAVWSVQCAVAAAGKKKECVCPDSNRGYHSHNVRY